MNVSTYIFGWILATLLGAVFHLWKDGGFWKLIIYIILSWVGFFIGHLIAKNAGFNFLNVGYSISAAASSGASSCFLLGTGLAALNPCRGSVNKDDHLPD